MKKKTGVLFSGGKDSCLALHKFVKEVGKVDVLLSMVPENIDSFMFHKPDLKLLKKQAEMLNLPLIIEKTKGKENEELEDLRELIKKSKIDKLIIGGIKSNYQGNRIKKICEDLRIELIAPLWNYDEEQLWNELLGKNFKVIVTKISSEGIPKDFIGKIIDKERLEQLKKLASKSKFRMDFEGGDAETAVLYMPEMKREIKLNYKVESKEKYRYFLKIIEIN